MNIVSTFQRMRAFLIMSAALFAIAASAAEAQTGDGSCRCDRVTIAIDARVQCKVIICYSMSPSGPTVCQSFGAGETFSLPCFAKQQIGLQLCDGTLLNLESLTARCVDVRLGRACCVNVCTRVDMDGCRVISIGGVACVGTGC